MFTKFWVRKATNVLLTVGLILSLSTNAFAQKADVGRTIEIADAAPLTAPTFVILQEGFEGAWPTGKWQVVSNSGVKRWDEVKFQPHSGQWSAQPADGLFYPNNLSTYMQYGPFALPATDISPAFDFDYLLNSEAGHDFFTWSYSCNNGGTWVHKSVSGKGNGWQHISVSLMPCTGKSTILVRFTFKSDGATPCGFICPPGVHIDDVRIYYTMLA